MTDPIPPRTIDGADIRCAFHTWDCSSHIALAGGFDEHHRWPKAMGGSNDDSDLLILCPTHHRRQHALLRTLCQQDAPYVRTLRWFSRPERDAAAYAYQCWVDVGRPRVYWNTPAAALYVP